MMHDNEIYYNHYHNSAKVPLVSGSSPLPKLLFGVPSTNESRDPQPSQAPEEPEKPQQLGMKMGWDMVGARWALTTYKYMGASLNNGTPKWIIMENPI